jgi:hypothetical protein
MNTTPQPMDCQMTLFPLEAANNIRQFKRTPPVEEWMVDLADYVTDQLTPIMWNRALEEMAKRYQ